MLKREMQEMIELMFYPDDYVDMSSTIIDNYETGMYMYETCDTIDNVNLMNTTEVRYDI